MPTDEPRASSPFDPLRLGLAEQIRKLVTGGGDRVAELLSADGPRWFDDDRPIRVVHSDASMFVGGLRALLLQSLHPLAMAGVAQHSKYQEDPWGRLQRTAEFLAMTTYGTVEQASAAVDIVHRVHRRVVGTARDGRPYAANDPHLLAWVHIAEVDSFVASYRRFGADDRRKDDTFVDGYIADMSHIASRLGVLDPPKNASELAAALRVFRRELRPTRESFESTRYLVFTPPLPVPARPVYATLAAGAVSLLPFWARVALGLPIGPVGAKLVAAPAGDAVTKTLRWALQPA